MLEALRAFKVQTQELNVRSCRPYILMLYTGLQTQVQHWLTLQQTMHTLYIAIY